jgi:hypothetical protein
MSALFIVTSLVLGNWPAVMRSKSETPLRSEFSVIAMEDDALVIHRSEQAPREVFGGVRNFQSCGIAT